MPIHIQGASEHNLKDINADIGDGLTVVTGVSGSGKTSLVFDTLYHEARRRFLQVYNMGATGLRLAPASVRAINGLGPAVAVGQNLLNRNPLSTLASAAGLHPFLRLLYARFGERACAHCGSQLTVFSQDEAVEVLTAVQGTALEVRVPLVQRTVGGHHTLLRMLADQFSAQDLLVDGQSWEKIPLNPHQLHDIAVCLVKRKGEEEGFSLSHARQLVRDTLALGAYTFEVIAEEGTQHVALAPVCVACGKWFGELEPVHFHQKCPHCRGEGCSRCQGTGMHPESAAVRWRGLRLPELLAHSVEDAHGLFSQFKGVTGTERLRVELLRRLEALQDVGLGYIALDRPSPTLSRGEAQRVRLAVALTSRLEDMLYVLDEPTIGQHPQDVRRLLPVFRRLAGPVIFVEHDRLAASAADQALDLGPGAGADGGRLLYSGAPAGLWEADTPTGRYFSGRAVHTLPGKRPTPSRFLTICEAHLRNLKKIDIPLPLGCLTVISGVSGSGKSTLVEDVLVASLREKLPNGCRAIEGPPLKPMLVDQEPIGRNPRSNPATYTKLLDILRELFAAETGLSSSHFSFNRPEGACPTCKGMGAVEVKMRYLPSTWIPCADCEGERFSDEVLAARVSLNGEHYSIADVLRCSISEALDWMRLEKRLPPAKRRSAVRMLEALETVGLGYLTLGQPSPTLSGGEAQRVKLSRFLGRTSLSNQLFVLDEPSTGLHPQDLAGLLAVLDRLVRTGATVVLVEHNLELLRAADWVVDLGPGAGPAGGELLYAGPPAGLLDVSRSFTGRALCEEDIAFGPRVGDEVRSRRPQTITIRNARTHNLKGVDVSFPRAALSVVTGVSGSGKSSLVMDVLEVEARRRFLESLSMYERQGVQEGVEAQVDAVSGLGVTVTVTPERRLYDRRMTVGIATEISHHLALLLSALGKRACLECGKDMQRGVERWACSTCGAEAPFAQPRYFSPSTYGAACRTCHGVGTLQEPMPEKLIIYPEKPLCAGAMYSPGFFPKGYLCKPFNGGYYMLRALAQRHGFDPETTPWQKMSNTAQQAFLFGDPEPMQVVYYNRKGERYERMQPFPGFYGFIRDWDVGGTYTRTETCTQCRGAGLRPEYLAVCLAGLNVYQLHQLPLDTLTEKLAAFALTVPQDHLAFHSLQTVLKRLEFLLQVGLAYLHLGRLAGSLSAGEAQRIKLASLLGSGLTALTVLLDEPSRGLHPREVDALIGALRSLQHEGNSVIVVEHEPSMIQAADYLVEMGPGAGTAGGEVVAEGPAAQVLRGETVTARWLREGDQLQHRARRTPQGWLKVVGARANNLQGEVIDLPLGVLVGICGVSGSGKSTLVIDTLGRVLAPKKQTTSVAYEPIQPGEYDQIVGAPPRALVVDQARAGVVSPASFLGLDPLLRRLYAASEDAHALGLDEKNLGKHCSVCNGNGVERIDMGFLPAVYNPCETCRGTGFSPEAWQVSLHGLTLPQLNEFTLDEVYEVFAEEQDLARLLGAACDVGLGYLALYQPGRALSGGEAQRLKIARELARRHKDDVLYILDEPTVGQHLADVHRLVGVLGRLVDDGASVLVVEHHPHLLAACDWLVELGPGGGPQGGCVIAGGTPEQIAAGGTPTAAYVRAVLEGGV